MLCAHSTVLKSPVPAAESLTAARTNCLVNETTEAKEKKKPNDFYLPFTMFKCSELTSLLRNPFIILFSTYYLPGTIISYKAKK